MHPPTPNITRAEDQPSSTSTLATPLSQHPTRTLLSTARTPISSLSSTYLQTGSTLFTSQQPCQCDFETERQRHLKQNQDIIRLVALKSLQIRRSEADISQLERANMELTVALHRAKKEQQENSLTNPTLRHNIAYSPVITSLQEEWAQLGQTQQAIPHLQRQIDSGLPQHHQHTNHDIAEWRKFRTSDADIMLSLTPRSKRRKLEYLAVSSAIPRDLAMLKLEHIRTIYQLEQNALVEMMRSHRSTTELYTETLRILSEDRVCNNSSVRTSDSRSSRPSQVHTHGDSWDASDQGCDQPLDPSHFSTETVLLPPNRPAWPSVALAVTPPYHKRASEQQSPSSLPFFVVDTGHTEGDPANEMLTDSRLPHVDPAESSAKSPSTSSAIISSTALARSARQRMAFGYNSISPTERTPQLSNYPREQARRLRRPASRIQETALPVLSERTIDTLYDTTDISVPAPSRSILTFNAPPPVPRQLVTSQDLIVGNQRPRPAPASPRTPRRQLKTSPYRRQAVSIAVKVSPSAAAKRGRYTRERAKARVQSKKLVAKFSNMGTIDQASVSSETPSMATSKGKGTEIEHDISINAYDKTKNTVKDAIELNTPTLPTNTSAANASGKSTARSPSRIPQAIPQQRRSGSSSLSVRRRSSLNHDKLKSLTAGQLLRRMNKTLLGTSRPPVLTRTIVQKSVPSNIRLASRRPAAGGVLSTATAGPSISPPSTTSLSSLAVTLTSTIATEPIADSAVEQTTPLVATVAKVRMTTKSSVKSADSVKSRRVTRSTLANRFRRVTRSTTAAASQIL